MKKWQPWFIGLGILAFYVINAWTGHQVSRWSQAVSEAIPDTPAEPLGDIVELVEVHRPSFGHNVAVWRINGSGNGTCFLTVSYGVDVLEVGEYFACPK